MNVKGTMKGDTLVIEIDCSAAALAKAEASKSGKSKIVASTQGFTGFGPVKVSLNAITSA